MKNLIFKYFIPCLLYGFFFIFYSCHKDPPKPAVSIGEKFTNGAFIICEGNFTYGNAAVSFFHNDTKQAETGFFKRINGYPLGDVFQSMYGDGNSYFLVINNSQKIEVVDAGSFKSRGTISGFNSPRYYLSYKDKAFVSDLGANGIWVVDPTGMKIKSKIPASGWTEQMAIYNDELLVLKVKNGYDVLVVDPDNEKLKDSIPVGEEPQYLAMDKENKLWVLCNAYRKTRPATLHRIDPTTHKVILTLNFPSTNDAPTRLKINSAGDSLYFLDNGIYRMSINDGALPRSPIIRQDNHKFYGLGNESGIIYCSDALDFTQPGIVFRFRADGTPIDSFRTDPGPGDFYFVK